MSSYMQMGLIATGKIDDIDTTPWWVHQEFFEEDYSADVSYMCKARHRKEMDEMNALRRAANQRDQEVRQRVRRHYAQYA